MKEIVIAHQGLGQDLFRNITLDCWGQTNIVTLLDNNLNTFQKVIPREALSKTFQDAFELCRQLGIRYIWIDSLCIIQKSQEDWLRESKTMCKVYSCSSLNITATASVDKNGGLFQDRTTSERCLLRLHTQPKNFYTCLRENHFEKAFGTMATISRSWCFQERLLSPRTVHFTSTEVFWECMSNNACESCPVKYPEVTTTGFFEDVLLRTSENQRTLAITSWPQLVTLFSRTNLTNVSDKLPAIAGIAEQISINENESRGQRVVNRSHDYFAGLWGSTMLQDLMWSIPTEGLNTRKGKVARVYRAPSWSWASIDGEIVYGNGNETNYQHSKNTIEYAAKVVGVQLQPKESFGPVREGILRIKCTCMFKVTSDMSSMTGIPGLTLKLDEDDQSSLRFYYLAMLYREDGRYYKGLVIERTKSRRAGEYRRIGIVIITPMFGRGMHFDYQGSIFKDRGANTLPLEVSDFAYVEKVGGVQWGVLDIV